MSKGRRPSIKNQPDVVTVDREPDSGTPKEAICWQFHLEEISSPLELTAGSEVVGTIHEDRILVRSGVLPLGFAPRDVGTEIIKVTVKTKGRLFGSVASISVDPVSALISDIWVELCVR